MIRGYVEGTDGNLIAMLGITDGNVDRLKAGMPIDVRFNEAEDLGRPVTRVVISHGATHVAVVREWEPFVPPAMLAALLDQASRIDESL